MQSASRLLTDSRGSIALQPYQEDTVRAILHDIAGLSQGIAARLSGAEDPSTHALTVVQNFTLRRHKRCLIVYHAARCQRVEALRWSTGAVLPASARDSLCSSEVDYFKAYSEAVSRYLDKTGLDLTAVSVVALRERARARARRRRRRLTPSPPPLTPVRHTHPARAEPQAPKAGPHPRVRHPGLRRCADGLGPAHREPRRDALYEPRGGGAPGAAGPHGAAVRVRRQK